MKVSKLFLVCGFGLLTALGFSVRSFGPVDRGNGTDKHGYFEDSAWFTQHDKNVAACIETGDDFTLSKDKIAQSIQKALSIWGKYFDEKHVKLKWRSSLDYTIALNCNGDEDITFYMGVENEKVRAARAEYFDPVAFAHRESYDPREGWGKGFVWVRSFPKLKEAMLEERKDAEMIFAPDWTKPDILVGAMLHELGHVLGIAHIEGTIMSASYVRILGAGFFGGELAKILTSIEHTAEVITNDQIGDVVMGEFADTANPVPLFSKIMNRAPVGKIAVKVLFAEKDQDTTRYEYTLTDAAGSADLSLSFGTRAPDLHANQEIKVLYAARLVEGPTGKLDPKIEYMECSPGSVRYGFLTTADGQSLPVLMTRNMVGDFSRKKMAIYYLDGKGMHQIFGATRPMLAVGFKQPRDEN
jgi:hypothetical protein